MDRTTDHDARHSLSFRFQEIYRWTLQVTADLTEDQLSWQPNVTTSSIRFHLFHIARWADVLWAAVFQHVVPDAEEGEIWQVDGIAARWGLDPSTLGLRESGALIDDESARSLPFPDKERLLAYCTRVLSRADAALEAVDEAAMGRITPGWDYPIAELLADQLSHTARHLGMIECLRGIQGLQGTASV